jgi:hypothetical protein
MHDSSFRLNLVAVPHATPKALPRPDAPRDHHSFPGPSELRSRGPTDNQASLVLKGVASERDGLLIALGLQLEHAGVLAVDC